METKSDTNPNVFYQTKNLFSHKLTKITTTSMLPLAATKLASLKKNQNSKFNVFVYHEIAFIINHVNQGKWFDERKSFENGIENNSQFILFFNLFFFLCFLFPQRRLQQFPQVSRRRHGAHGVHITNRFTIKPNTELRQQQHRWQQQPTEVYRISAAAATVQG